MKPVKLLPCRSEGRTPAGAVNSPVTRPTVRTALQWVGLAVLVILYVLLCILTCDAQGIGATPAQPVPGHNLRQPSTLTITPQTTENAPSVDAPRVDALNAPSFAVQSMLAAVERMNKPDSTKRAVGRLGVGIAVQSNGAVLTNVTKRTRWGGYITFMVGRQPNAFYAGVPSQHRYTPVMLTGLGFPVRPYVTVGGLVGAQSHQALGAPTRTGTGRIYQPGEPDRLQFGLIYGLQLSTELRHLWLSINLIHGSGIGVGGTYFF